MTLKAILQEQQRDLTQLLQLLQQEQHALMDAAVDGEDLQRLAANKQALLQNLVELDSQRNSGDSPATAATIRRADCLGEWQSVEDLARRCNYLNQLNGALLNQRMQHNQRMLRSLRQLAGNQLYGSDGQTHKGRGRIQTSA